METIEFYKTLWGNVPDGWVNIRLIHITEDKPQHFFRPVGYMVREVDRDSIDYLHSVNHEYQIYHRVSISRRRNDHKSDIRYVPGFWCDVDDTSDEAYTRLQDGLAASMVIFTGGGYHGYWLLDKPFEIVTRADWELVEQINHGIAIAMKADEKCRNINRILRTPGFRNIKPEYGDDKPLCRVMYHDEDRFTLNLMQRNFAPLAAKPQPKITRPISQAAYSTTDTPRWIQNYLQTGAPRGERNQRLFSAAVEYAALGWNESAIANELLSRAMADGLTQVEAIKTIHSAVRFAGREGVQPALQTPTKKRIAVADQWLGGAK